MRKLGVVIFGLIFVAVGIFVFLGGNEKVKRCTEEVIGTVVDIKEEESRDSNGSHSYIYYPVIQYQARERTITKKSDIGHGSTSYIEHQKLTILYNPNNVEEYVIKGDNSTNLLGIIFIALGGIVVVLGIVKQF